MYNTLGLVTPIENDQLIQLKAELDKNGSKSQKVLLPKSDSVIQEHLGLGRFEKLVILFYMHIDCIILTCHYAFLLEKLVFKIEPKLWDIT